MPTVNPVFAQNVQVIEQHLKAVAGHLKAGNTEAAAATLDAVGQAAQWLGKAILAPGSKPRPVPPSMLPGKACNPKIVDPFNLKPL
jgi:hypothetical protein